MKIFTRRLIRSALLLTAKKFTPFTSKTAIPVLAYHSVNRKINNTYSMSISKFKRQIEYLKTHGYESLTLNELYNHIGGRKNISGRKKVVLVFDDGFKDFKTSVLPILKENGFDSVVSVVTDFCSKGWSDTSIHGKFLESLSWKDLNRFNGSAVEIASHGVSHKRLTSLTLEEARWEIKKSKEIIESAINNEVNYFCYPFGDFNRKTADIVRECGYKGAMTTEPGLVKTGQDVYRIKRILIREEFSLIEFSAMLTMAVEWYTGMLWSKYGQMFGLGKWNIF